MWIGQRQKSTSMEFAVSCDTIVDVIDSSWHAFTRLFVGKTPNYWKLWSEEELMLICMTHRCVVSYGMLSTRDMLKLPDWYSMPRIVMWTLLMVYVWHLYMLQPFMDTWISSSCFWRVGLKWNLGSYKEPHRSIFLVIMGEKAPGISCNMGVVQICQTTMEWPHCVLLLSIEILQKLYIV